MVARQRSHATYPRKAGEAVALRKDKGGGRVRHDRAGEAGGNVKIIILRAIGIDLTHKQAHMVAELIEELRKEQAAYGRLLRERCRVRHG